MNTTPLEIQEQISVVDYLELLKKQGKVLIFSALPNNLFTKSWSQKRKQTKEGLRPGFPDLCIVLASKKVLFVEMKRTKGSNVSDEQKDWQKALQSVEGNVYHTIAYGAGPAIDFIKSHLI